MTRVYIGNLDSLVTEKDLENEFLAFGIIRSVWMARKPPGFAFIEFDDCRAALQAVSELDGKNRWRVELANGGRSRGGSRRQSGGDGGRGRSGGGGDHGRSGRGGSDLKCYFCGDPGHFSRDCRNRGGSVRHRSRTPPRYHRSPSYRRSSHGRSPRRRSISPRRRSYNRSPCSRGRDSREDLRHANRNGLRDRRRSGS